MLDADHRGFRDLGVADREVLDVDRGYPFAPGLDHVLGAVGDLHVAVRSMVATSPVSKKPSGSRMSLVLLEIGARDRRAAHLEPAEGLAVPRQPLAGVVGDLHLDA